MTEIDIINRALTKNHVLDEVTSSDGTVANITSTGLSATLAKRFYAESRRQILRLAPWTCIQTRKQLACRARTTSTAYALGDQVVGSHGTIYSVYKCTTAGTTGSSAVTWPASGTVTDGTVIWTFQYDVESDLTATNFSGFKYGYPLPKDYVNQVDVTSLNGRKVEFSIEGSYCFCDILDPILVYVPDVVDPNKWDPLLAEAITMQTASAFAYPLTGSHENEIAFAQIAMNTVQQAMAKSLREKQQGWMPTDEWMNGLFSMPVTARTSGQQQQQGQ
jgi:hypothetical protein